MKSPDYTAEPARGGSAIDQMKPTLEDGLRALRESTERAASIRIELDDAYLQALAFVEGRPGNQSGADKNWVSMMEDAFQRHYANARRR